ncbi:hypothetical protein AB0C76_15315 [Kitasatospora sp. NPDC048722]|uniref:hypothetical protein n=1 Tax=Kitasatospora sp. NPDC048722 TaxID=3155639 RepID=UPI0033C8A6D0
MLRATPGAERVSVRGLVQVGLVDYSQPVFADFCGGDDLADSKRLEVVKGHTAPRPNEIEAGPTFLDQHGLKLGDRITLDLVGRQLTVTLVGEPRTHHTRRIVDIAHTMPTTTVALVATEYGPEPITGQSRRPCRPRPDPARPYLPPTKEFIEPLPV